MPDVEKLTINLSVVDLGQIDLLVEEGFYSNRSDFIRAAIRSQLGQHQDSLKQAQVRRSMVVGVLSYNRADLEKRLAVGEKLSLRVIGLIHLANDIPAELADKTIESISILGVLRASDEVRQALSGRISST
jgi:Arc/MetJ-type ribon-helix-helix transcriptional regulator